MRVDSITNNTFGAGVHIKPCDNKGRIYLYNEINSLTNEFKIPAAFKTKVIELPSVSKEVLAKLNELGIKFVVPKATK